MREKILKSIEERERILSAIGSESRFYEKADLGLLNEVERAILKKLNALNEFILDNPLPVEEETEEYEARIAARQESSEEGLVILE